MLSGSMTTNDAGSNVALCEQGVAFSLSLPPLNHLRLLEKSFLSPIGLEVDIL